MAVSRADFDIAKGYFFSLDIVDSKGSDEISVIAVTIQGIRGSKSEYRRTGKVEYRLLADVSDLSARLPKTWIVSPQDDQIEHVNIYRPALCPLTNTRLPYLCWGNGDSVWRRASAGHRTLGNYLEAVRNLLGNANLNSVAR
jgi:hypothetical protein